MGMQDLRRRIASIESTKKITKAMSLVSTAKLKKARDKYEAARLFNQEIHETIFTVLNRAKTSHPYLEIREIKKKLVVVITSDMGLCGGYNVNVYKKLREIDNAKYIILGTKGVRHYAESDLDIISKYESMTSNPDQYKINEIIHDVLELYIAREIDAVDILYTKFINSVTYEPTFVELMPIPEVEVSSKYMMFDPSATPVLDYIIPNFLEVLLQGLIQESYVSEQASRRMAMDNATDNAFELNEKLILEANRLRQSAITQEIAEIVGGAEAQN